MFLKLQLLLLILILFCFLCLCHNFSLLELLVNQFELYSNFNMVPRSCQCASVREAALGSDDGTACRDLYYVLKYLQSSPATRFFLLIFFGPHTHRDEACLCQPWGPELEPNCCKFEFRTFKEFLRTCRHSGYCIINSLKRKFIINCVTFHKEKDS